MPALRDKDVSELFNVIPLNDVYIEKKNELRKRANKLRDDMEGKFVPIVYTDGEEVKLATELTKDEQKQEYVRCALDPIYFIETYLTVFDQTRGEQGEIVPFKLFPFQKKLIESFQTFKQNIANKYRQAGVSTTTCAYIAWYVTFNKNRTAAIVANKLDTARDELMADVTGFIETCPEWLQRKPTGRDAATHKIYDNGSELKAFSSKGLRGPTPTLIFWDETAWTERAEQFWTATRPAVNSTGGRTIFVSTPNGLDPVFYKTFEDARRGESNFNAVELWWYNDPRYTRTKDGEFDLVWIKNKGKDNEEIVKDEHWAHEKRLEMVKNGYVASSSWFETMVLDYNGNDRQLAQELLCSFLGSGDNFIAQEHIQRIEQDEMKDPIRKEYVDKNMWIWEDEIDGADYLQIIDASAGHGDDNSTVNVFKITEEITMKAVNRNGRLKMKKAKRKIAEQVAEYYGKVSPQVLGDIAYQYGIKYNNAYTVIDVTGGYGTYSSEKLLDLGYENVHYSQVQNKGMENRLLPHVKTINKTLANGIVQKIDLVPGFFIGNNRPSVLIEMERAVRMKDVIIRSSRMIDEMKTFVTVEGSRMADHKRSFHDDSLIGMGIGMYVLNFDMDSFGFDNEKTKKVLDAFLKLNNDEIIAEDVNKKHNKTLNTQRPDFRVSRNNPYGANAWLFKGLDKKRR